MAAAIPLAVMAGSAVYNHYHKSAAQKAQAAGQAGTTAIAQGATTAAQPLLSQGTENLGAAGSYYKQVLGSRSAAQNAVAPETQQALDYYKGAEGKASMTMRGGARDNAVAELERQKVGQLSTFMPMARANAAQGAGQVGNAQTSAGANLYGAAGSAYGQLFNQGTQQKKQEGETGAAWGKAAQAAAGGVINYYANKQTPGGGTASRGGLTPGQVFSGGTGF